MADRTTHSHDTSTPAMSAETVPSEEFVLVPKRALDWLDGRGPDLEGRWFGDIWPVMEPYWWRRHFSDMIAATPTLSASHLAKEGREAGVVEALVAQIEAKADWHEAQIKDKDSRFSADRAAAANALRDMASEIADALLQPSPALAKGGDAVREALKPFSDMAGELFARNFNDGDQVVFIWADGKSLHLTAGQFFALRRAIVPDPALSTPTEGPASQTEGMGGDAEPVPGMDWELSDETKRQMEAIDRAAGEASIRASSLVVGSLAALTPPETAEAVPVEGCSMGADGSQATLSDGGLRHLSRITEIVRAADSRMEAERIALGYLRGAMSNEERVDRSARDWAVEKWHEEVANRPLQNAHRRCLDTTWRQVIRYFGGDDEGICGPRHDDLVATHDGLDFAIYGTQVKPLEWQRFDNGRTVTYRAMCPLGGIYYITSANEDPSFEGWKSHLGEFASLEAAKAAQQAEHDAKVRGCLARSASSQGGE